VAVDLKSMLVVLIVTLGAGAIDLQVDCWQSHTGGLMQLPRRDQPVSRSQERRKSVRLYAGYDSETRKSSIVDFERS
jgi:hypothetical protein